MSTERFEDLETRLTFQEKLLLDLNDVIVAQRKEIDELRNSYQYLLDRVSGLADGSTDIHTGDETPPHY